MIGFPNKKTFACTAIAIFLGVPSLLAAIVAERFTHPPWYYNTARGPNKSLNFDWASNSWMNFSSNPKKEWNLSFEEVEIPGYENSILTGWYIPSYENSTRGIVAVHGAGADRREFLRMLPLFHKAGFHVLMFDCREHGTSSGTFRGVSFGLREHVDVLHAIKYMKNVLGISKIAIVGTSQGGSSVLMAASKSRDVVAVVAENPFSSMEEMISDVIDLTLQNKPDWSSETGIVSYLVSMGTMLPGWFRFIVKEAIIMKVMLFSEGTYLSPIESISTIDKPVMFLHGTADTLIPMHHSQKLYARAREPKFLWVAEGGEHSALYNRFPKEYEEKVVGFLNTFV